MNKKKLVVSFSGGRTSAYMLWWLFNVWEDRHDWEILVVFANTGKEVEGTLFFVDECSQEWGIPITWVEGYPSEEGKGWSVKHKIVTYETASRNGEPFEAMIKRLGIPSSEAAFCSPQLKREPIKSFLREVGWEDYYIAIGIRWDEQDRVDGRWMAKKIMYPLVFLNPVLKRDISIWWSKQSFDLNIHPDDGNCDGCWKKSWERLVRIRIRKPNTFDWWNNMIQKYGEFNPRNADNGGQPFRFYRGNSGIDEIDRLAEIEQAQLKQMFLFENNSPCNESCEIF